MRFFPWVTSCIIIALAIAAENLLEDSENTSNVALFFNEDQTPIDMLAMTDFSTPYSFGQESLNPSEPDDLASNIFSPEGMDPVLIADTPNECSTSIGSERRIRRGGETFCSSQDSTSGPFDYSKLDWSKAFEFPMTDFDRQKCGVQLLLSFLVCSAPDLSDALTARLFALGTLEHCTRVYNAEDLSKCVPPSKLYCCRLYSEPLDFEYDEWASGQPLTPKGMGSLCTPLEPSLLP